MIYKESENNNQPVTKLQNLLTKTTFITTGRYLVIPCLWSSLFYFVMYGTVLILIFPWWTLAFLAQCPGNSYIKWPSSHRQKAWDDGVAPSVTHLAKGIQTNQGILHSTSYNSWTTAWTSAKDKVCFFLSIFLSHYHFQVAKSHLSLISTVSIDVDIACLDKHLQEMQLNFSN